MLETLQAPLAQARCDRDGVLFEASEPLAGLQRRCGGEMPGPLAIPELLELVRKVTRFGFRLSRQVHAIDGDNAVKAWVDVEPQFDEADGALSHCLIRVLSWQSTPAPREDEVATARKRSEIDRLLAEFTARLDEDQRLLSVEADAPDLEQAVHEMTAGIGLSWLEFAEIDGKVTGNAPHWRLLDGSTCRLPGSERNWRVRLEPLGAGTTRPSGYILYLSAETVLQEAVTIENASRANEPPASIGRDLAPVLRQPITRIIANAETIRTRLAGPIADEYSDYARDIASAGQHLLALIDDLGDLEVVEAEDFTTTPEAVDLAEIARRAAGILSVRARERGINIVVPQKGETEPATGEFRRVLQILLNLLGNAVRYSPEGSEVWLCLDREEGYARVTVADQGAGLNDEEQDKVFEKFERLGRSGDGGSGLGLYISRKIARVMGGDLTVESAPGQGARFTLSVPVT
ncbi:sensor histidine kinase [Qipengyuania atrilutea]|uniref:histidine kinase n=1 Tax=Qipengyuania atrilutea TaxID=2744473 RepID=A0A850H1R2_9SPHN|nr:sensor histidine kinase [Actirhodobacter atriluteus]NVD43873.1 HAMP domain-containing histidine kinase [Actirhodobacter atriluteus]